MALVGGCFANRLLRQRVADGLARHGLMPVLPRTVSCGDAGLALGQAWVARAQLAAGTAQAASAPGDGAALAFQDAE